VELPFEPDPANCSDGGTSAVGPQGSAANSRHSDSAEMSEPAGLTISVLGEFKVARGGNAFVLPASRKARALLIYLAITGRAHRRDRLCAIFWDTPDDPRGALRSSLSKLRAVFDGPDRRRIVATRDTVRFDAVGMEVDLLAARRRLAGDLAKLPTEALEQTAAVFRGEFAEGLELANCPDFEAWRVAEREDARRLRARLLSALVERHAAAPELALSHARALVQVDPGAVAAHGALLRLLIAGGRRREAEEQFEVSLRVLAAIGGAHELTRLWRSLVARAGPGVLTGAQPAAPVVLSTQQPALLLPDKPSIAVLPFANMSDDVKQEYFADGVVQEIITALSRFRSLFVIAASSSFTYKGRPIYVKQISHELGVRYVLEGSVRRAGNRVRITAQLINATTGAYLWADRLEGAFEEIFDLQDRVAVTIVGAIAPKLEQAEIERARYKPTDSLDAYDFYMRGMASVYQWSSDSLREALKQFYKAIELDPHFASAYGMAAWCYIRRLAQGAIIDREKERAETERLARQAARLGKDDALALCAGGFALARFGGDHDAGISLIDRALTLNPNLSTAWFFSGWARMWSGEPELAIKHEEHAMRLSPLDPLCPVMWAAIAFAHFCAGRYEQACLWATKALRETPDYPSALRMAAASNALTGRLADAQNAVMRIRQVAPTLRVSNVKDWASFRRPEDLARLEDGLRKAGLPE
jgi:TolB-like protein/DNA-binding SARP family transcriptional activator